jgi:hypothetical protein
MPANRSSASSISRHSLLEQAGGKVRLPRGQNPCLLSVLSQEGPDTRLVVTHRRLANRKQLLSVSAGWHVHVGILIDLLSESAPRSFWPEHIRLEKVYEGRFAD